ncbi:MFS transporter [Sporomusaceae bacterium FL31]|nr:MFS transporter [Sporomusaceae bacterium FL31]GCE34366.1 MFS transporter [Sporomusaceae bacterium]
MRNARDINKQVSRDVAMNILNNAEYGVLSTVDKAGQPYGVPLNYIVLNDAIYLHCALEGHKLDNISDNNRVSFTVIGYSEIVPAAFTAKYESVVVFGKANLADEPEKVKILKKFIQRYSPEFQEKGMKVIDAFKDKCTVIRIEIEHISGMRKK